MADPTAEQKAGVARWLAAHTDDQQAVIVASLMKQLTTTLALMSAFPHELMSALLEVLFEKFKAEGGFEGAMGPMLKALTAEGKGSADQLEMATRYSLEMLEILANAQLEMQKVSALYTTQEDRFNETS